MIYLFIDSIGTTTTHYPVSNAVLDIYVNNVHEWIPNYDYLHDNTVSDSETITTTFVLKQSNTNNSRVVTFIKSHTPVKCINLSSSTNKREREE